MRKSWALRVLPSVAIAVAGVAWAADNGAGSPKTEGTGQPTEKMQGDTKAESSSGPRTDQGIDRLPAKREAPKGDASSPGEGGSQGSATEREGNGADETDNGSSDMTAPPNPASPPTTLFPANPKPPADPGKPGNPVTPTLLRIA